MLPCPVCKTKLGVKAMREHGGRVIFRNFKCSGCRLLFGTTETITMNEPLRQQLKAMVRDGRITPEVMDRVLGVKKFKYKIPVSRRIVCE